MSYLQFFSEDTEFDTVLARITVKNFVFHFYSFRLPFQVHVNLNLNIDTAESTAVSRIKRLAQGHNIVVRHGINNYVQII